MQIRKLCCTCMRAQAVSRLIFLKIYVNCILQCTGNLVAALYLQMWEGSQISIDKSKPKRYVSVLVCSTAGSGKSFKGLGLGSAHLKSKTLKSERIRGRSKRKGSWKKIEILNQELNFSRLLLPVRRSVVRAWGEKKPCWSLFMVILITTVLSPRAASFPSASASFHSVSVLHEDLVALVEYMFPPTAAAIGVGLSKRLGPRNFNWCRWCLLSIILQKAKCQSQEKPLNME